jgi:ribonuclease HI
MIMQVGVLLSRDHRDEVVAAITGRTKHVSDAFHGELTAAVQALRLVEHLGAIRIILESDSQLLINALNSRQANSSSLGVIIDELRFEISTIFSSCNVIWCKRELNRLAHELPRIVRSCVINRAFLWEYEVPAAIAGIVGRDALIKFNLSKKRTLLFFPS